MSVKQDRGLARTVQDIERKYSFGKSFADILGLVNESRDRVNSVESSMRNEMKEQSTILMRDAQQIIMKAAEEISGDIADVDERVTNLSKEVELKIDADAVNIIVEEEISKGVDRVETETGYRFDSDGMNISKSGEEMSNTLDHKGMYVKKSGENILVADKDGVAATDLHAKTYLVIGAGEGRSRIEDYGIDRTGLFWIGG